MARILKCFLSYAQGDKDFVREEIAPVLYDLGMDLWLHSKHIASFSSIQEEIMKGIRQAHIIVAVFNKRSGSAYVNFEVGVAIGQNKPTLAIVRDHEIIPFGVSRISILRYSETDKQAFNLKLRRAVKIISNNLIDKSVLVEAETGKVIGISIGIDNFDVEQELRFTADFLSLIKKVSGSREPALVQTRKGSFTSFFSIDLKSWAELIEKLIFFIPEWQKRKAENLKIHAEIKKIEAETNNLNTDSRITEERLKIEQAKAMLELLEKYKALGIKIQFGNEILLSLEKNGLLSISKPESFE